MVDYGSTFYVCFVFGNTDFQFDIFANFTNLLSHLSHYLNGKLLEKGVPGRGDE